MKISRRGFVSASLYAGAGLMLRPGGHFPVPPDPVYFRVNPFVTGHPDAVFVMRTNIDRKTDSTAIKNAGLIFGRSVFTLTADPESGVPLSHKFVIKPNLTCRQSGRAEYTVERSMGIVTDVNFVEGIIESIRELGVQGSQFYIREVNCSGDLDDGGYIAMAQRTGIDLRADSTPALELSPDKVQWIDVPQGVWFRKIPYLWPVNAPDTFLLNIAKFKAHSMGLTLCAKNLQGTVAMNYQAHCSYFGDSMPGVSSGHISPTAFEDIYNNYERHVSQGIPRWKRPGFDGGLWQETWATRCLDNNSVTHAGLHIIEGIYGRDGDFMDGPGGNNLATDFMTNYIIFGMNQFYVDIIGHYLGGHEPGNFGLFHMARERGMITTINPAEIPLYEWNTLTDPAPVLAGNFQRYSLRTKYLRRDYDGQNEEFWHLVDEPFYYTITGIENPSPGQDGFYFSGCTPNPVRTSAVISFHLPVSADVSVEILNSGGQVVETIIRGYLPAGDHAVDWNSSGCSSGLYLCRVARNGSPGILKLLVSH